MEDKSLALLESARSNLALVKNFKEARHYADIAAAAADYAKRAKLGLEAQNDAAAIYVRYARKAGEFLEQIESQQGQRNDKLQIVTYPNGGKSSNGKVEMYQELGISKGTANRWQQLAEMPESVFEKHIEDIRSTNQITVSGIIKDINAEKTAQDRTNMAKRANSIKPSDKWQVHNGDMTTIKLDRQFDFIITDPPYPKEFLPLWYELGRRSVEWLKEGGLLIAMSGQSYVNEIYKMLDENLEYYWTASYLTPGQPTPLRQVNVNSTWKPLLIYSKGKYTGKIFGDVFVSDGNDKSLHKWGQSESGMTSIITGMCLEGQSILDPFCGAGTTLVSGLLHNCFVTGIELDEQNANIAKGRLAEL